MFLYYLLKRDLKLRYAGFRIGVLWNIINPLYFMLLYIFVFGLIFKIKIASNSSTMDFVTFLFAGFLPWNYFQDAVFKGVSSLTDNASFIKKINQPLEIYFLASIFSPLVSFFLV